jgi:Bacteriophage tail sheath protein
MPSALTYPGVYIEEIPSGVRTITGVATSITAFIGRTRRGPTNSPVTLTSFGDFERTFGGLDVNRPLSYAVRDFFVNGGSQAIVVRVVSPNVDDATAGKIQAAVQTIQTAAAGAADPAAAKTAADTANTTIQNDANKSPAEKKAAKAVTDAIDQAAGAPGATLNSVNNAAAAAKSGAVASTSALALPTDDTAKPLLIEAADAGGWGNDLAARVDRDDITDAVFARYKALLPTLKKTDLFNLSIANVRTGAVERFLNLTVEDLPRRVDRALESESRLARAQGDPPAGHPPGSQDDLADAKIDADASIPADKKQEAKDALRTIAPFSAADTGKRSVIVAPADRGGDGGSIARTDVTNGPGLEANKLGLFALDRADLFNLLCLPPDSRDPSTAGDATQAQMFQDALPYCVRRRAMLIIDPPASWTANPDTAAAAARDGLPALNLTGPNARNAALYFPRVRESDPLRDGQLDTFVPCGIVAGIMARTDTTRGVWKAPAGLDATLSGVQALDVNLNDGENGLLNPLGINCLRFFPVAGRVVWGSRTLRGADQLADEYKYVPVRRTALFLEESLYRGLQWVVFEPNDEPLWAQIRLNVGAFMQSLFRQGAFQGTTPRDAYFVKCDNETTTQTDINLGIVNIIVGFAPLKPAEFVVIKLQQMAGQIPT